MYLGVLLGPAGVIFLILGRNPFGQSHSNYVFLSIVVWVVGLIAGLLVVVSYAQSVAQIALSGIDQTAARQALTSAFNDLIVGILVFSTILGIADVLITYGLQDLRGRLLLFAAFATSLTLGIIAASIITPQINNAVAQAISTNNLSPLEDLRTESQLLGLLGLIPAAVWAFAYHRAYSRISRGEIPAVATHRALP
jgi:hypothetical protein